MQEKIHSQWKQLKWNVLFFVLWRAICFPEWVYLTPRGMPTWLSRPVRSRQAAQATQYGNLLCVANCWLRKKKKKEKFQSNSVLIFFPLAFVICRPTEGSGESQWIIEQLQPEWKASAPAINLKIIHLFNPIARHNNKQIYQNWNKK